MIESYETATITRELDEGELVLTVEYRYTPAGHDYRWSGAWYPGDPADVEVRSAVDAEGREHELTDAEVDRLYALAEARDLEAADDDYGYELEGGHA